MSISSGAIRAGRAFVELFADEGPLQAALGRAQAMVATAGAKISGAGKALLAPVAAITAPALAAARSSAQSADALARLSDKTGIAIAPLSKLQFAADMTDTSIETVTAAIGKMQKTLGGLADETEGTFGRVDHLGLSLRELAQLDVHEQFAVIGRRINEIKDPAQRTAAAMSVFGRSAADLLPLFAEFDQWSAKADQFGFVKDADSVRAMADLADQMQLLGKLGKSVWGTIGSFAVPVLRQTTELMLGWTHSVRNFLKEHKEVGTLIVSGAAALGLFAAGLVTVGTVISKGAAVFGVLKTVLSLVVAGVGTLVSVGGALVGALATPLGIVAGVALSLGAAFVAASGAFDGFVGDLSAGWQQIQSDSLSAWAGIRDALAAGDLGLAAKVGLAFLQLEWARATNWLLEKWEAIKSPILEVWDSLVFALTEKWIRFSTAVGEAFASAMAGVQKAAVNVAAGLDVAWQVHRVAFGAIDQKVFDANMERIGATLNANSTAIDSGLNKRLQELASRRAQDLGGLSDARDAQRAARDAQRAANLGASEQSLADAKAGLDAVVAQAAQARVAAESVKAADTKRVGALNLDALQPAKRTVSGSFSARQLAQFAGSVTVTAEQRALNQIVKNTGRVADQLEKAPLAVFK